MIGSTAPETWLTRRCLVEPIPEIYHAAELMRSALAAHQAGACSDAERLLHQANDPVVRGWVAPLLGHPSRYPELHEIRRVRPAPELPDVLPKEQRQPVRMPTRTQQAALLERHGYNCAFCGIPLVRKEVRAALCKLYPTVVGWGASNDDCHAALLCMWLQYDHVLPHSRGGTNELSNLVVTCAGCNYGRMGLALEEVGLENPLERPIQKTDWDGLEGFRH